MDAGAAWTLLTHNPTIGVQTGNIQCFLRSDRQVECDVSDSSGETVTLNHSEFLATFNQRQFREIMAQDV